MCTNYNEVEILGTWVTRIYLCSFSSTAWKKQHYRYCWYGFWNVRCSEKSRNYIFSHFYLRNITPSQVKIYLQGDMCLELNTVFANYPALSLRWGCSRCGRHCSTGRCIFQCSGEVDCDSPLRKNAANGAQILRKGSMSSCNNTVLCPAYC